MTAVETRDDPIGETPAGKPEPEASPELVLLAPAEIQFELRRLVRRLAEGARLLRRCQAPAAGDPPEVHVLLDLEVDGLRCLLTRLGAQSGKGVSRLTTREREVAHMVAMGLTTGAIAGKLSVSPWTVSTHLRRIFAKLDVSTRAAMVAVLADR
ncbi:LuxR C-terminal-related transcriptional regulator [Actinoplanes sp. NPDC020271]|uniref:helix-turn-helix transcriptional regulator n=1 Tax=Actinoplanes sp. NPDC020271 TaxID=3363896 RepID=UPI00378D28F0